MEAENEVSLGDNVAELSAVFDVEAHLVHDAMIVVCERGLIQPFSAIFFERF